MNEMDEEECKVYCARFGSDIYLMGDNVTGNVAKIDCPYHKLSRGSGHCSKGIIRLLDFITFGLIFDIDCSQSDRQFKEVK